MELLQRCGRMNLPVLALMTVHVLYLHLSWTKWTVCIWWKLPQRFPLWVRWSRGKTVLQKKRKKKLWNNFKLLHLHRCQWYYSGFVMLAPFTLPDELCLNQSPAKLHSSYHYFCTHLSSARSLSLNASIVELTKIPEGNENTCRHIRYKFWQRLIHCTKHLG